MNRQVLIPICLVALLATACRGLTPGAPPSPASGAASVEAAPESAGSSVQPGATCHLGVGIAEYAYPGLREFVGEFQGISRGLAVAEVVSVGPLQYSTERGDRPSCEEIEEAQAVFSVGRLIEVRVLTPAGGTVEKGEVLSYLYQGGSLGADSSPGHPFDLELPSVGDRMLVLVARDPLDVDPGSGELPIDVLEMFLITPQGKVVTPNPSERVTVDRVADLLRDVLPSPAPDG